MSVMTKGKPGEGMGYNNLMANQFPVRFRQMRKNLKLKQAAMADRLGISLQTLQRYEKGTTSPTADVLERVAALGVDIHWLITGLPTNQSHAQIQPGIVFFAFRSEQFNEIETLLRQKDIPVSALHQIMENHLLGIVYSLKYLNEKPI